jgi:ribonuclease T
MRATTRCWKPRSTPLEMTAAGELVCGHARSATQSHPFAGANIEQASLDFTGIDPYDPHAAPWTRARCCSQPVCGDPPWRCALQAASARSSSGHNAFFDHGFVFAAAKRQQIKRNPFHPFSTFDTVTLAGMAFGQTVLAKACAMAGIEFSTRKAHRAGYDCEKTAELFCVIVNDWQRAMGWPPAGAGGEDD